MAFRRSTVSLSCHRCSHKSLNSIQVVNTFKHTHKQANGHTVKIADDDNDREDSDDDKEDEGGAGDAGSVGGKLIYKPGAA